MYLVRKLEDKIDTPEKKRSNVKNDLVLESHEPSVEPVKGKTVQAKADKEPTKVKINAKKQKK